MKKIFLFIIILIVSSCSKDSDTATNPSQHEILGSWLCIKSIIVASDSSISNGDMLGAIITFNLYNSYNTAQGNNTVNGTWSTEGSKLILTRPNKDPFVYDEYNVSNNKLYLKFYDSDGGGNVYTHQDEYDKK